jgi:hypothetical protein
LRIIPTLLIMHQESKQLFVFVDAQGVFTMILKTYSWVAFILVWQ